MSYSQSEIKWTVILIGGIIDLGLLFTSVGMWLWSIFGYSILSAEDRKASAELSDTAGNLFWAFLIFNVVFGVIVNIMLADEKNVNRVSDNHITRKKYHSYGHQTFCEECGCPDVTVYSDGTCECNGCGYTWRA
jgi:hypothetical protein